MIHENKIVAHTDQRYRVYLVLLTQEAIQDLQLFQFSRTRVTKTHETHFLDSFMQLSKAILKCQILFSFLKL